LAAATASCGTWVATGGYHNLALRADGTIEAWGNNDYGQTNVPPALNNVVARFQETGWKSLLQKRTF
jgi:alpha-tubulin suppressor-like RCC1 family protein